MTISQGGARKTSEARLNWVEPTFAHCGMQSCAWLTVANPAQAWPVLPAGQRRVSAVECLLNTDS